MSLYPVVRTVLLPLVSRAIGNVTGTEHLPGSGCVLAANHVDWLDGFYISAAVERATGRSVKYLTASNNYWWTGVTIQIPDEPGAIVGRAVQELKRGQFVCNFPEGHRNPDNTLAPGRTGTVRMAAMAEVPVVPVGIIADPGRTMKESIRFGLSGLHQVELHFGAPLTFTIPPGGISHDWLTNETARLMAALAPIAKKSI